MSTMPFWARVLMGDVPPVGENVGSPEITDPEVLSGLARSSAFIPEGDAVALRGMNPASFGRLMSSGPGVGGSLPEADDALAPAESRSIWAPWLRRTAGAIPGALQGALAMRGVGGFPTDGGAASPVSMRSPDVSGPEFKPSPPPADMPKPLDYSVGGAVANVPAAVAEAGAAGPVAQTAPAGRIRAIRLPNGQMLFTNRDEYGGEEFTPEQGGRIVREQQRARIDPTSATMSALVNASVRAAEKEIGQPEPQGRMVPGTAPEPGAGVTFMPRLTDEGRLQDILGGAAIGEAEQKKGLAELPLEKRAQIENKDIVLADYLFKNLGPQLRRAEVDYQKARMIAAALPEASRRQAETEAEAAYDATKNNLLGMMSLFAGQRLPTR